MTQPDTDLPEPDAAEPGSSTMPSASPSPEPSGDSALSGMLGRYRIERKLGEGGMGAVYLAHDTVLDRAVAVKIPNLGYGVEAEARFQREARAAAALQHPNICPIFDLGCIDGTHYLCMGYIAGDTLASRVGPGRPLNVSHAVRVIRACALAMQYAHSLGVIHRDLKPVNIMMDGRDEPIVMDFGLAKRSIDDAAHLTMEGQIVGTPAYMPPEQVLGRLDRIGAASDIYSLGVVLYELLTGTPPYSGSLLTLLSRIPLGNPDRPSLRRMGIDPALDRIVLKALERDPENRWPSMKAFADALAGFTAIRLAPTTGGATGGAELTLRIAGTAVAWKPPPGLPTMSIGRQKRKPGEPPSVGNDFVLRVQGNDALSMQISRRHMEIDRHEGGFRAKDVSKTGVERNGSPMPPNEAVELTHGDILTIAGAICLEVILVSPDETADIAPVRPAAAPLVTQIAIPAGAGGGRVELAASVGDMVTQDI